MTVFLLMGWTFLSFQYESEGRAQAPKNVAHRLHRRGQPPEGSSRTLGEHSSCSPGSAGATLRICGDLRSVAGLTPGEVSCAGQEVTAGSTLPGLSPTSRMAGELG